MMPLTLARPGEENFIKKIHGRAETRQFLENLGFVPGNRVTIVSSTHGNLIVSILDSRVAISREMACGIYV